MAFEALNWWLNVAAELLLLSSTVSVDTTRPVGRVLPSKVKVVVEAHCASACVVRSVIGKTV